MQPKVHEDLLHHMLPQDRRDDLQIAGAVLAVVHVDIEHAADPEPVRIICPRPIQAHAKIRKWLEAATRRPCTRRA